AATVVKVITEYGAIAASAFLGQSVVRNLRDDVFDRIIRQPLRFFDRNPTGELMSRISADIERVQSAASDTLAEALKQGATVVFMVGTILYYDWKLTLASFVLVPLVLYPTAWFGRRLRSLSRSNQQEMADMSGVIYEAFSGNRIVKAFLMESSESRRFSQVTHKLFRTNMRQKMTHALSSPLMEILGVLVIAAYIVYVSRQNNPGLMLFFILALVQLYDAVRRMSGINNSFQQAFGASDRIFEILEMPLESDTGTFELAPLSQSIDFENVSFAYNADAPVLSNVSFRVNRGEVVAIVGASGAGKSTLVNLVPRFFDVSSGAIRIDNRNLRDVTLQSLRKQIAVVTQDVILFDDTIQANIAYGDSAATKESVRQAAKAALADDFVSAFADKYDTRIGERGLRLSGGERQRISIARAILKNAPILILDEATSSLDSESEIYVQRALENLMEGRTTIVIAHRLSTIRRADRIIVLSDGRVCETGTHDALIARQGVYWKLHSLQFPEQL
ncbi:MAG TPA: ABC transporter transmembrane domain-containing protein, partial [Terriglobia bacterium]|nr:ABC transporter transmembrane domain-containing protein [Terriglobia bacterium]